MKIYILQAMRLQSSFRIAPSWSNIGKKTMTSQFSKMTSSPVFLNVFASLGKFSYWSKFHVDIIIGSGVMTSFIYKRLTRNPESGRNPVWVLSIIWSLGWVRDTRFSTNKMLFSAAKCQGYMFYHFWVIKGKPTGGKLLPSPFTHTHTHTHTLTHRD